MAAFRRNKTSPQCVHVHMYVSETPDLSHLSFTLFFPFKSNFVRFSLLLHHKIFLDMDSVTKQTHHAAGMDG